MENEAVNAVNNAKRWYKTATDAYDDGNYDTCVYSLEMALEIGLKSIFLKFEIEYPKIHDVIPIFKLRAGSLKFNKKLEESLDEILETFQLLLKYRNDAGYMFSHFLASISNNSRYSFTSGSDSTATLFKIDMSVL